MFQSIDNEEFMSLEELLSETKELEDLIPAPLMTDSSSKKLSELQKLFIDYDNQELINVQDAARHCFYKKAFWWIAIVIGKKCHHFSRK